MLALLTGEEPEGTHKKSEVHFAQPCLQPDTSMACTEKLRMQYVFLSAQSHSDYETFSVPFLCQHGCPQSSHFWPINHLRQGHKSGDVASVTTAS